MGKKRIIKKSGTEGEGQARGAGRSSRRKVERGILFVNATYNNTLISLTDDSGNAICQSSSGALGYTGAKKGTPFAASKVVELISEKAKQMGLKEADIVVKGVGAGRESAVRTFVAQGFVVNSIKDTTPVPFNGPKAPKPRRV